MDQSTDMKIPKLLNPLEDSSYDKKVFYGPYSEYETLVDRSNFREVFFSRVVFDLCSHYLRNFYNDPSIDGCGRFREHVNAIWEEDWYRFRFLWKINGHYWFFDVVFDGSKFENDPTQIVFHTLIAHQTTHPSFIGDYFVSNPGSRPYDWPEFKFK